MQRRASAFNGYTIEAVDGKVGYISDVLFEDNSWKLRWFVINTGSWLEGRKILVHPSALGQPDVKERAFPVELTKAQVEASPDIQTDQPVSMQLDQRLTDYYGYSPSWAGGAFAGDGVGLPPGRTSTAHFDDAPQGDAHLRSLAEVTGYHIHALDGDIGHLEDFLVDDETWAIEFAVIDTKNWGFGHHVLVAPAEIKAIDWSERYFRLDLTCYKIKSSRSWKEPNWADREGLSQTVAS